MINIGFIGLGHMGRPIAEGLIKAHFNVLAYDVFPKALEAFSGPKAHDLDSIATHADVIISMVPSANELFKLYDPQSSFFKKIQKNTLLIDCSTIGPVASQQWHQLPFDTVDAPVSGGIAAAKSNTLTYMIGGLPDAVEKAEHILKKIAKQTLFTGGPGTGQIAKICNNLILGNTMIAVSEAFLLAEELGLSAEKLHSVLTISSGYSWVTEKYLPVPNVIDNVPANQHYQPGFTSQMMLKDLKLANDCKLPLPLTQKAQELYEKSCAAQQAQLDFSAIFAFLKAQCEPFKS